MTSAAFSLGDATDPAGQSAGIESFADELKPGTQLLLGQFTIDSFLSAGGFGITYLARDSLDRRVVIKECFPSSFCRRNGTCVGPRSRQRQDEYLSIVGLFLQEAQNLSQMDHPNIVKVHQVFQDNETAYMAMDWIDGPDLLATMEGTAPRLTPDQIVHAVTQLLDALGYVHSLGFLHRDISPDNILLDRSNGEPVLIDFGAARKDVTRKSRVLSGLRVVKDGYSPQEFYISGSKQAPCSDLYALAASFCHLVSGETPKTSQERLSAIANGAGDPQRPLVGRVTGYEHAFLAAIDTAMSIFPRDRLQSAADWQSRLQVGSGKSPVRAGGSNSLTDPVGGKLTEALLLVQTPEGASPEPLARALEPASPQQLDTQPEGPGNLALPKFSVAAFAGRFAGLGRLQGRRSAKAMGAAETSDPAMLRVVQLPFVADAATPGLVLDRLPWSPDWVEPGGRIVMVNGKSVTEAVSLQALMAGKENLARRQQVTVDLGYLPAMGGSVITRSETLPVVTELHLGAGFVFEMQTTPTGVRTVVRSAPEGGDGQLAAGDILLSYLPTGEILGTTTALSEMVKREGANQIATFGFAVQRKDNVMTGAFQADAL